VLLGQCVLANTRCLIVESLKCVVCAVDVEESAARNEFCLGNSTLKLGVRSRAAYSGRSFKTKK